MCQYHLLFESFGTGMHPLESSLDLTGMPMAYMELLFQAILRNLFGWLRHSIGVYQVQVLVGGVDSSFESLPQAFVFLRSPGADESLLASVAQISTVQLHSLPVMSNACQGSAQKKHTYA